MAAQPFPNPKFRAFDSSGAPLSGGLLYTYEAGTSTPLATYTNRAGTTANANPVVLDANGEADVWLTPSDLYKFELRNSAGVVQWTVDNLPAPEEPGSLSTFAEGITVTQTGVNTPAVVATGNGTAPALSATGGDSSGAGVEATGGDSGGLGVKGTGAGTGAGVVGFGAGVTGSYGTGLGGVFLGAGAVASASLGNNAGVQAQGGGSGGGVVAEGGPSGGIGVSAVGGAAGTGVFARGGAGGVGAICLPGTDATATVRQSALYVSSGDILFLSVVAPASTLGMANRLTAHNTPKAWGRLVTSGSGSTTVTVSDGFNIASASVSGNSITVTLADDMANTNYAVVLSGVSSLDVIWGASSLNVGSFLVNAWDPATAGLRDIQAYVGNLSIGFVVFGAQ